MVVTKRVLWLSGLQLEQIFKEYHCWAPNETGGILMGYRLNHQFWITDIVGPGPKAKHEQYSFTPNNDFHEAEMARIYQESGRIHTYLGDWHTHPQSGSYLSERDKKTMRNISGNKLSRLPQPIMLIFGTAPLELNAWMYQPGAIASYRSVQVNLL